MKTVWTPIYVGIPVRVGGPTSRLYKRLVKTRSSDGRISTKYETFHV